MIDNSETIRITNSLESLVSSLSPMGNDILSTGATLSLANAYTPLTLNRILLSYSYMTLGLVQTVIDQPVEDAFRGGLIIKSDELDEDNIKLLCARMKECKDIGALKKVAKWARLYGGAGLIIGVDSQEPSEEFRIEQLTETDTLELIDADRWELLLGYAAMYPSAGYAQLLESQPEMAYSYYGKSIHPSRVLRMNGREAPSFIRQRLQGWGMSEIERCIRSINAFVKFQTVIFELIDEAKIDVYKITGFTEAMGSSMGEASVRRRIELANMLKNYKRALTMDITDDYQQKTQTFSGIADIYQELRLNLSSDLKIPMNKLFGESAAGFSSGEDAIENYNSIVESDVRGPIEPILRQVIDLRCQQLFGFIPEYQVEFHPLRVLDAEQEENVKDAKHKRAMDLRDRDLLTGQETMELLHQEELINMETEVGNGTREPQPMGALEDDEPKAKDKGGKKDNAISVYLKKRDRKAA